MKATNSSIQKLIILFWSIWFSIVTLTNILDGAKASGILPKDWKFSSGNFELMLQTTANLGVPFAINVFLFCGVIALELISAVLFWKAVTSGENKNIYSAHGAALILFAGFILSDEIFFAYSLEATHMRIFFGLLISLATLILLRRTKVD